jgi:hypothetical protein
MGKLIAAGGDTNSIERVVSQVAFGDVTKINGGAAHLANNKSPEKCAQAVQALQALAVQDGLAV